jgi:hypothetical protein
MGLAAHGVLMSDEQLPLVTLDLRGLKTLEGRILVHGEEETGRQSGRSYLMLEGTDGRVCEKPAQLLIRRGSFGRKMAGMDGSGAITRCLGSPCRFPKANA